MYTVTYRTREPSEDYSLIRYGDWAEVNGLLLPMKFQWFEYKEGKVGEPRGEAIFENIELSTEAPDKSLFEMPAGAAIAPR